MLEPPRKTLSAGTLLPIPERLSEANCSQLIPKAEPQDSKFSSLQVGLKVRFRTVAPAPQRCDTLEGQPNIDSERETPDRYSLPTDAEAGLSCVVARFRLWREILRSTSPLFFQVQVADIGFMGAAARDENKKPCEGVDIFLGGRIGSDSHLGECVQKGVPVTKLVPVVEELMIKHFGATRKVVAA